MSNLQSESSLLSGWGLPGWEVQRRLKLPPYWRKPFLDPFSPYPIVYLLQDMAHIKPKSAHTKCFCLSQQICSLSLSSASLELQMGLAFLWTPQPLSRK